MRAAEYQQTVRVALQRHFADVRVEWSVVTNATDSMARDIARYAPRVDVAVGPFNVTPGPDDRIVAELLPHEFHARFVGRPENPNPRCLLAIEVVFSGSSKHIMGDILNAGALGLYGIVIGTQSLMPKIQRISAYLRRLDDLEKLPPLFRNVVLLSTAEVDALSRSSE
jgi:hypothetical protein